MISNKAVCTISTNPPEEADTRGRKEKETPMQKMFLYHRHETDPDPVHSIR
jgi:hypothetical protein